MNGAAESSSGVTLDVFAACRECESTLRTAALLVEDPLLRTRLAEHALVWKQAIAAVAEVVTGSVGDNLERTRATLRRAWIQINAAVNEDRMIIAECERCAAIARRALQAAFDREIVPEARAGIRQALECVGALARLE